MNVVLLFPGQGSQKPGMAKDLVDARPAARETFATVDAALGESLSTLCFDGPGETLTLTAEIERSRWYRCSSMLYVVTEKFGLARRFARGSPASEMKVKLRNVETTSTGML